MPETVYVRARSWGIAGNHEEIIFSPSPLGENIKYLEGRDLIYYTSEVYYKKQGKDSLIIYAPASSMPTVSESKFVYIKVRQVELEDNEELKDIANHYREYGLSKVTAFKK